MHLLERQKDLDEALNILNNLDETLLKEFQNTTINPTTLVAAQALVKEIKTLIEGVAVNGVIKRSMRKIIHRILVKMSKEIKIVVRGSEDVGKTTLMENAIDKISKVNIMEPLWQ